MTTTYNYNNLDQITSATTTTDTIAYSYDGRGNLVQTNDSSLGITQYSYDGLDRLTGVTPPGGNEATYEYDADGRRTKQTIGSNVTNFVWDEASTYGDVVAETDGSSAIQASYVLAGEHLLQQKRGSTVSYYLQDGQGSVRELTDINGDITDKYSYNAYGTIYASTGSTVNQYRYAGQQLDDLTGLYSLRTRYYNPVDARFLSRDTINPELTDPTEFNRYIYALDSPISFSDPTGQMALVEEAELTKIPQKVRQPLILIGAQILADLAAIALALHQLLNPLPFPFPVPNPNPNPTPTTPIPPPILAQRRDPVTNSIMERFQISMMELPITLLKPEIGDYSIFRKSITGKLIQILGGSYPGIHQKPTLSSILRIFKRLRG